jgi:hypothetical protein
LPEIGRELNVNALVEGTVTKSGDSVRITVQPVDPSPERNLWADEYEGDIRDVLSLQRDLARDIARKIQAKLAPSNVLFHAPLFLESLLEACEASKSTKWHVGQGRLIIRDRVDPSLFAVAMKAELRNLVSPSQSERRS